MAWYGCRGDVPEDMGMAYEQQRRGFEALHRQAALLGEVLDRPLPHLPQANLTRLATSGGVTALSTKVRPLPTAPSLAQHPAAALTGCQLETVPDAFYPLHMQHRLMVLMLLASVSASAGDRMTHAALSCLCPSSDQRLPVAVLHPSPS